MINLPHNFAYIFLNFPIFFLKNNFYATTWFNFDLPSILAEFMYLIQKIFFIDTMIIFNFKKSISRISEKKILSYITLQIGAYAYNILKKHIIMSINVTEKELDLLSKYHFI